MNVFYLKIRNINNKTVGEVYFVCFWCDLNYNVNPVDQCTADFNNDNKQHKSLVQANMNGLKVILYTTKTSIYVPKHFLSISHLNDYIPNVELFFTISLKYWYLIRTSQHSQKLMKLFLGWPWFPLDKSRKVII